MAKFLVDTNVLMAASAVNELSNLVVRAMPREIELREAIFDWLSNFEVSDDHIVLDEAGLVRDEYDRNIPYNWQPQEYGLQVLQNKLDRNMADYVPIETFEGNGEHIAVLELEHEILVSDREDRKWVACALAASALYEESPPIVYGAETDWYVAGAALSAIGIAFCRLLPDVWYQERLAPR